MREGSSSAVRTSGTRFTWRAVNGMVVGALVGIVLAVLEKVLPGRGRQWVPGGPSIGLAFVIAPSTSFSLFFGSMVALGAGKVASNWSSRFLIIAASGIIAGESLSGVFLAMIAILGGGG